MRQKHTLFLISCGLFVLMLMMQQLPVLAAQTNDERLKMFIRQSMVTQIPWEYLAAIDQYERTMQLSQTTRTDPESIAIRIRERIWSGALNPQVDETNVTAIYYFNGAGRDGNGDGKAVRSDGHDQLAAICAWILRYGPTAEDVRIALWDYYENMRSVQRIEQFAAIYAKTGTLQLTKTVFPLPVNAHYTYRSTWGAARGWGGRRIHEGTDLFAPYGVPVRSTNFGVIETRGWNDFGGWRVGIRDIHNVYHYFAHLSGFDKNRQIGDVVRPGDVVGWVGSSGYGKPGTSGKFPPHLHYGTYRDHGMSDWAFDPYPKLRASEKSERKKE